MSEIILKLPEPIYKNLRALVVAGAKSANTDETAIMAAAHILQMMDQQMKARNSAEAQKPNGHAEPAQPDV